MNTTSILVVLSSVVMIAGMVPYIRDVVKGKTKPRIISWFIWTCLTGISFFASIFEKQYPTAILMLFSMLSTLSVVILGWKDRQSGVLKLDIVCLIGTIIGAILWAIFNSPSIAVIAMICIDFIGGIPTQVHCWKKPYEETKLMFIMSGVSALLTLLAIQEWKITAFAFPLFLFVINIEYVFVITFRKLYLKKKR